MFMTSHIGRIWSRFHCWDRFVGRQPSPQLRAKMLRWSIDTKVNNSGSSFLDLSFSRDDQDISNDDDIMIMNALQGSEVWIPIPLGLVLHFIERALVMSFPPNLNPTCALSTSNFLTPLQFESKTTHKQSQTHLQRTCVCLCKYVYNDTDIFKKIGI